MRDFFKTDVYQNSVRPNFFYTLKGNNIFKLPSEQTAKSARTGNYDSTYTAGTFVKIDVNDTAKNFTVTGVNHLLVAEVAHSHNITPF